MFLFTVTIQKTKMNTQDHSFQFALNDKKIGFLLSWGQTLQKQLTWMSQPQGDDSTLSLVNPLTIPFSGCSDFVLSTNTALLWQKEASDKSGISCKWAKCFCHYRWWRWIVMMSYLIYLLAGWVFLHKNVAWKKNTFGNDMKTSITQI